MAVLFIVFEKITEGRGISKKILQQVSSLKNIGKKVDFVSFEYNNGFYTRTVNNVICKRFKKNKVVSFFQRFYTFNDIIDVYQKGEYDVVYIRYNHIASYFFLKFLFLLRKIRNVKIILEIPTYPYDEEYKNVNLFTKVRHYEERMFRSSMRKYVDYIVSYVNDKSIFGIPSISISNGISLDNIPSYIENEHISNGDEIVITGVASMEFWHGYDRMIKGIGEYYKSRNNTVKIYFNLVGPENTLAAKEYKKLVTFYKLEEYVIFHNVLSGDVLDGVFASTDIAIGCLGCHRKGIRDIKSLKNREYCARSIPFVYSENDSDFDSKDFVFKVVPDESIVDIQKMVNWFYTSKFDKNAMRKFSETDLSWEKQFSKIYDVIDNQF